MAKKQSGLGKGLEALFADNSRDEQAVENIRIDEVEPNRDQPRKNFDEAALEELADSIRQHGVIQPILVRPAIGGSYVIIAGERRWRAARIAGLDEVPVIVKDMDDTEAAQIALIENLQREDLNPIEEAAAIKQLMEVYGFSQEQVAEKIGKSRSDVANKLRLLGLPESIGSYVAQGKISAGHARALLAVEDEKKREELVKDILEGKLTVRAVENAAKAAKEEKKKNVPQKITWEVNSEETGETVGGKFFEEMELALNQELHRKVKIKHGKDGKGTLEIEFYDKEELIQLAKKLSV